jgi:hypothetical protein
MGIIDTCTDFGTFKFLESNFKRCFQGKGVSCVKPSLYAKRFYEFLEQQFA